MCALILWGLKIVSKVLKFDFLSYIWNIWPKVQPSLENIGFFKQHHIAVFRHTNKVNKRVYGINVSMAQRPKNQ